VKVERIAKSPKLTMRAKAHKFEAVVVRLAVDENQIRPDIVPLSC